MQSRGSGVSKFPFVSVFRLAGLEEPCVVLRFVGQEGERCESNGSGLRVDAGVYFFLR